MSQPANQTASPIIVALVLGWLGIVVSGFWWFQYKDLNSFATKSSVVFFQGDRFSEQLTILAGHYRDTKKTTVVHFWDTDCGCNRFNEQHVNSLIKKYGSKNIQFLIVAKISDRAKEKTIIANAKSKFKHSAVIDVIPEYKFKLESMPSTPSVAVLNKEQKLTYFGPYSIGTVCNIKNGAFVEKTLNNLLAGSSKKQINVLATGCFCEWNDRSQTI